MKLKNIPILLMPLLLLTSLSACDNTSSNETVENIKIKSIDGAVVGDVIDLNEIVTIEGGAQVFDCELLTDETASIDGKKVTILKEGKVTIVVTSGDLEKSINFDAFSKEKYAYNKYANSVGSEFFIGVVDNSSTGTYLTSDGWLFGEDYTVYSNKAINNSGYGYQGQYFQGSSVYTFTMDDDKGENFKFGPGAVSGLFYINTTFTMSTNLFITGENGILEGESDAAVAMLDMLGYRTDLFEYYLELLTNYYKGNGENVNFEFQTKGVSAMMYDMVNTAGETVASFPVYNLYCTYKETVSGQAGTLTWGTYYLRAEEEYLENSDLYKTITEELSNTPERAIPEQFDERISSISNSKNYTMSVKSGWYDSSDLSTAKPIETPNLTLDDGYALYETIRNNFLVETEETTYVKDEEALYKKNVSINEEEKEIYEHLVKAENGINRTVNYSLNEKEYTIITPDTKKVEGTTIWDKSHSLVDLLADKSLASKSTRNTIYSEEYDKDEDADYNYVFGGAANGQEYLIDLLSVSHYSGSTWSLLSQKLPTNDGREYSLFEILNFNAFVYMTDDTTTINFKFGWNTSTYYHIIIEFSNVGSTVIPTL